MHKNQDLVYNFFLIFIIMSENFQQRQYMIFNVSELNQIDFNEVLETSSDTVRKSVDRTKTFVKWDGESIPQSVNNLTTKEGPYTHEEILTMLNTQDWNDPNNI